MTDVSRTDNGSGFTLRLLLAAVVLFFSSTALARLEIVATTTSLGMLASEIGGDNNQRHDGRWTGCGCRSCRTCCL